MEKRKIGKSLIILAIIIIIAGTVVFRSVPDENDASIGEFISRMVALVIGVIGALMAYPEGIPWLKKKKKA